MAQKAADQVTIVDVTDAYSVILTSEAYTFPGTTSAAKAGSTSTQVVAMVGGGNSAFEEALYLTRLVKKLYLIHRRDTFRADKFYQDKLIAQKDKVTFVLDSVVQSLHGDTQLNGLTVKNVKTGATSELAVDGLFIFVGLEPLNSFLPTSLNLDTSGFVETDCEMQTNIPGLFAAGDIRSKLCRQIITAAGDGATAAHAAYAYLEHLNA